MVNDSNADSRAGFSGIMAWVLYNLRMARTFGMLATTMAMSSATILDLQ